MPIETKPMLPSAHFLVEESMAEVSLIDVLEDALRSLGCELGNNYLEPPHLLLMYMYDEHVVAVRSSWFDTPTGEYDEGDECPFNDIRLDIDKEFAREHRRELIEFALPYYAHDAIIQECFDCDEKELHPVRRDRIVDRCAKALDALFDSTD